MKTRNCIVAVMLSAAMAVSVAVPSAPLAVTATANEDTAVGGVSETQPPDVSSSEAEQETLQEAQQRADEAEKKAEETQKRADEAEQKAEEALKLIEELQAAALVSAGELENAKAEAAAAVASAAELEAVAAAAKELLVSAIGTPTVTLTNTAYNKIRVSWEKMSGVNGYYVYRATSKNGTYTKIKTAKTADSLYTTNTGLTCGTTYYYKVQAYVDTGTELILGSFSDVISLKAKPAPVVISRMIAGKKKATIRLKKLTGVAGYRIYRSTSETGTFKRVKSFLTGETLRYQNTGLVSGRTYYYKARAYYSDGSKTVWGDYSPIMSVTVK